MIKLSIGWSVLCIGQCKRPFRLTVPLPEYITSCIKVMEDASLCETFIMNQIKILGIRLNFIAYLSSFVDDDAPSRGFISMLWFFNCTPSCRIWSTTLQARTECMTLSSLHLSIYHHNASYLRPILTSRAVSRIGSSSLVSIRAGDGRYYCRLAHRKLENNQDVTKGENCKNKPISHPEFSWLATAYRRDIYSKWCLSPWDIKGTLRKWS